MEEREWGKVQGVERDKGEERDRMEREGGVERDRMERERGG